MRKAILRRLSTIVFGVLVSQVALAADDNQALVLQVADRALSAINAGDSVALTDLMIEEGMFYSSEVSDGEYTVRSRTWSAARERTSGAKITERGFDPQVMISGEVAMIWYPYDLYVDDQWSHCGVDIFTLLATNFGWKISSFSWSVEQPPACRMHPDGVPAS